MLEPHGSLDGEGPLELQVLSCSQCGAALAIGDDDTVVCPFCGTRVPVPEKHRRLRETRTAQAHVRAHAEQLLGALDRPPGYPVRLVASLVDQPLLVFVTLWVLPLGITSAMAATMLHFWVFKDYAESLQSDDASFALGVGVFGFILFLLVFTPRAIGIYASRRATARAAICAALAARPPETEGGPAECRNCTAPLFVEPGATVVSCMYCTTENAVRLKSRVVAVAMAKLHGDRNTIAAALETDRQDGSAPRRELVTSMVIYAFTIGATATLSGIAAGSSEGSATGDLAVGLLLVLLLGAAVYANSRGRREEEKRRRDERQRYHDIPWWVRIVGALVPPAVCGLFLALVFSL